MNEISSTQQVESHIYRIRGQQVMLDSDLAYLYGVRAKALNQAVHRNIRRFPPEFMFQISSFEFELMRSQFVTAPKRNIRFRPLAFTEHGIAMLSSVLKSERAIQINIAIIKAFIKLRHAIQAHQGIARRVEKLEGKISILDTDVRLMTQDIRELKKDQGPDTKLIKGFTNK